MTTESLANRIAGAFSDDEVAQHDLAALLRAVGLSTASRPYSPHEVVHRDLLPRLAGLVKDAARLDWIESEARQVGFELTGYDDYDDPALMLCTDAMRGPYKTVREAIDSAIADAAHIHERSAPSTLAPKRTGEPHG